MKVWLVMDGDYDYRVVAIYDNEAAANTHAENLGLFVDEAELLSEIASVAIDPVEIQKVKDEAKTQRRAYEENKRQAETSSQRIAQYKLEDQLARGGKPKLCCCQTFSPNRNWTPNGYCSYCGGWEPQLFQRLCGNNALFEEIAKLEEYRRIAMRAVVSQFGITEWPEFVA